MNIWKIQDINQIHQQQMGQLDLLYQLDLAQKNNCKD